MADEIEVEVEGEGGEEEEEAEEPSATIFAVKTSIGHEKMVAEGIASRAKKRKVGVYSILAPMKLRGYLLVESVCNIDVLQNLIKGLEHARRVVTGETSLAEIEHFLTPKPIVSGIEEGDIVEIIAGPFKGEKAKVGHVDEPKEEITVELFEAMVSIPVTIRGDHVRVLEKEKK
jgi:transcriptional antiterminator NusG